MHLALNFDLFLSHSLWLQLQRNAIDCTFYKGFDADRKQKTLWHNRNNSNRGFTGSLAVPWLLLFPLFPLGWQVEAICRVLSDMQIKGTVLFHPWLRPPDEHTTFIDLLCKKRRSKMLNRETSHITPLPPSLPSRSLDIISMSVTWMEMKIAWTRLPLASMYHIDQCWKVSLVLPRSQQHCLCVIDFLLLISTTLLEKTLRGLLHTVHRVSLHAVILGLVEFLCWTDPWARRREFTGFN